MTTRTPLYVPDFGCPDQRPDRHIREYEAIAYALVPLIITRAYRDDSA